MSKTNDQLNAIQQVQTLNPYQTQRLQTLQQAIPPGFSKVEQAAIAAMGKIPWRSFSPSPTYFEERGLVVVPCSEPYYGDQPYYAIDFHTMRAHRVEPDRCIDRNECSFDRVARTVFNPAAGDKVERRPMDVPVGVGPQFAWSRFLVFAMTYEKSRPCRFSNSGFIEESYRNYLARLVLA